MTRKKTKKEIDREVDVEFEAKTKDELLAEFAGSQVLHVPAKKGESKLISIRLPMALLKRLRDIAIKKGDIGYQQLIKTYLAEALDREEMKNTLAYQMKVAEALIAPIVIWSGETQPQWRMSRYSRLEPTSFDASTNRILKLKERR